MRGLIAIQMSSGYPQGRDTAVDVHRTCSQDIVPAGLGHPLLGRTTHPMSRLTESYQRMRWDVFIGLVHEATSQGMS